MCIISRCKVLCRQSFSGTSFVEKGEQALRCGIIDKYIFSNKKPLENDYIGLEYKPDNGFRTQWKLKSFPCSAIETCTAGRKNKVKVQCFNERENRVISHRDYHVCQRSSKRDI